MNKLADPRIGWLLAGLATLVVFSPAVLHGWVMWDDPAYIIFNRLVHQWGEASWSERLLTPSLGYPAPLPVAVYAASVAVAGDQAARLIHAVSIVVHALNAALVTRLALRWMGRTGWATAAGLIWALHPVVVEAVAWASDLKEVLLALGVLLGLLGWQRALDAADLRAGWPLPVGLLIAFAAKPTAIVLAPLLFAQSWVARDDATGIKGRWLVPSTVTAWSVGWYALSRSMHDALLGAEVAALAARSQLLAVTDSLGLQALHYVWPVDLQPYYPLPLDEASGLSALGVVAGVALLAAVAWALWRRSRVALALALAVAAYVPYSNLLPLPRITADTYLYIASVGLAVLVAAGLRGAATRWPRRGRPAAAAFLALWLLASTGLTTLQLDRWRSTEALFGPLLGTPERFALPYALVAYEKHVLERHDEAARLLEVAWPRLRQTPALPRFAAEAFLAAGRPDLAADARLQTAVVHEAGRPAALLAALSDLAAQRLPPPQRQDSRAALRAAAKAWQTKPPGQRDPTVGQWLRRHGLL